MVVWGATIVWRLMIMRLCENLFNISYKRVSYRSEPAFMKYLRSQLDVINENLYTCVNSLPDMSIDTLIDDEQFKVLLQYIYAQIRISRSNEIKSFIQTNPLNISRDEFKPSDAMQLLDLFVCKCDDRFKSYPKNAGIKVFLHKYFNDQLVKKLNESKRNNEVAKMNSIKNRIN